MKGKRNPNFEDSEENEVAKINWKNKIKSSKLIVDISFKITHQPYQKNLFDSEKKKYKKNLYN